MKNDKSKGRWKPKIVNFPKCDAKRVKEIEARGERPYSDNEMDKTSAAVVKAIREAFTSPEDFRDGEGNVVDALLRIAHEMRLSRESDSFISNGSVYQFGQYINHVAQAMDGIADGLHAIATAIEESGKT